MSTKSGLDSHSLVFRGGLFLNRFPGLFPEKVFSIFVYADKWVERCKG